MQETLFEALEESMVLWLGFEKQLMLLSFEDHQIGVDVSLGSNLPLISIYASMLNLVCSLNPGGNQRDPRNFTSRNGQYAK